MKRIEIARYGSEDVLQFLDSAAGHGDPIGEGSDRPGAGEVVIEVRAVGVNPADTYLRAGNYEFLTPDLPFTPGYDAAGTVTATGSSVEGIAPGDRVWVSTIPGRVVGTYAQQFICTAEIVHPLPEHLSFDQGAALGVSYTTAYRALCQRGSAAAGEIVLVHGASGGVGTAAIQIARALGLTVIGTASTETGRDLVLNLGAAHALDHTAPGYLDKTYALTHGRGVDLIIEMAAHKNLQRDTGILARNGRVVIVGSRGPVEISPRSLMVAEADIRGTALWNMTPDDFHDAYAAIDRLVAEGLIHPVIGKQFPLEEAAEAHRFITNSHALGKVILHPYG